MPRRPPSLRIYGIFPPVVFTEQERAQIAAGNADPLDIIGGPGPAKARRKVTHPEDDLHKAVAEFLTYGIAPAGITSAEGVRWVTHTPERKGHLRYNKKGVGYDAAGARNRAKGVRRGEPDIEILAGGRKYGVELKSAKGVLSYDQHLAHAQLRAVGVEVAVCRSVDQVQAVLNEWGIPVRVRVAA